MQDPFNFQELMSQAKKLQETMKQKAEEAGKIQHRITVGGDMLELVVNGKQEVLSVKLDPQAIDPNDVEMLEDLIRSAFNEAVRRTGKSSSDTIGKAFKDFNVPGFS